MHDRKQTMNLEAFCSENSNEQATKKLYIQSANYKKYQTDAEKNEISPKDVKELIGEYLL